MKIGNYNSCIYGTSQCFCNVPKCFEIIDKTKNLIAKINDRHIFPHARVQYMMRSVDANAERFVLAVNVIPADSIVRYREGDFNETVYVKGDGYTPPATPEEIIALHKRKYGVDNETSEIKYDEKNGRNISTYVKNTGRTPRFLR